MHWGAMLSFFCSTEKQINCSNWSLFIIHQNVNFNWRYIYTCINILVFLRKRFIYPSFSLGQYYPTSHDLKRLKTFIWPRFEKRSSGLYFTCSTISLEPTESPCEDSSTWHFMRCFLQTKKWKYHHKTKLIEKQRKLLT